MNFCKLFKNDDHDFFDNLNLGPNYDRFCGGYLNVDSDEEESIPLYSEVSSQIIWLQVNMNIVFTQMTIIKVFSK